MTKDELKRLLLRAFDEYKDLLLNAYKKMYEIDPNQYKGACKISNDLGLSKNERGEKDWFIHGLLNQLKEAGFLEKHPTERKGFRWKKINN